MEIREEDFKKFLKVNRRIQSNTLRTYLNRFKIISSWFSSRNLELNKENVADYLYFLEEERGLSNSAINTHRNTLVHMDAFCKYKNLSFGFTEGTLNRPKTHPEITILAEQELKALLTTPLTYKNRNGVNNSDLDKKYLTFTKFMAYTGCRIDEASLLKIKRLDIEDGRAFLIETKNGDNRYVYFEGDDIKSALRDLTYGRDPEDLVFTGSTGKKVLPGTFNDNLRLRAKHAGINNHTKLRSHILRHTFATQMLRAGNDITIVSKLLGHKDIRVTYETYIHLADETLKKAIRKHPLVKPYISAQEIIEEFKEQMKKFDFGSDKRFEYVFTENNNGLELKLTY